MAKQYNGRILLRIPKSLHKKAAEMAKQDGVSLNQFIMLALSTEVGINNFEALRNRLLRDPEVKKAYEKNRAKRERKKK